MHTRLLEFGLTWCAPSTIENAIMREAHTSARRQHASRYRCARPRSDRVKKWRADSPRCDCSPVRGLCYAANPDSGELDCRPSLQHRLGRRFRSDSTGFWFRVLPGGVNPSIRRATCRKGNQSFRRCVSVGVFLMQESHAFLFIRICKQFLVCIDSRNGEVVQ